MEPLLGEGPRVASVTTMGPTQALVLDGPKFLALLHRHVDINMTLLRFTTRRLQAMNASRIDLLVGDVPQILLIRPRQLSLRL